MKMKGKTNMGKLRSTIAVLLVVANVWRLRATGAG